MNHSRSLRRILTLTTALVAALAAGSSDPAHAAEDAMGTLVSTEWLSQHLDDPDLVVLDCTVRIEMTAEGEMHSVSGRADYEAGHIPTAGFADLTGSLSDPDSPMKFALPDPERFCAAMGALGVGDDTRVVLCDDYNTVWAARVWWMLRWVGFDRAAILDGGSRAWKREKRPLSTEPARVEAKVLTPSLRPELVADQDEVQGSLGDETVLLVDAMPEAHYRGDMVLYGRPGHIPGAVNVPSTALFDDAGHLRPQEELEGLFGRNRTGRVITYCGGGIAASASAFALTRLGHEDVAVYMGSLQEWNADPENPLTTDGAGER